MKKLLFAFILCASAHFAEAQVFLGGNIQNDFISDFSNKAVGNAQLFNLNAGYSFRVEKVPGLGLDIVPLQFSFYKPAGGQFQASWSLALFVRYYPKITFKKKDSNS